MKVKSVIKIVLDIIMTVLFTVLLFAYSTGLAFHEIMGLAILFMFGFHLGLNRQWIISVSKKLFNGRIKNKILGMYLLNIGLLIGIITIATTGLMISTVVIPRNNYNPSLIFIHKWSAYITAGLIVIHLVLHTKYIYASVKKLCTNIKTSLAGKVFSSILAIGMISGIIYYNIILGVTKNINENPANINITSSTHESVNNDEIITSNITKKEEEEEMITSSVIEPEVISLSEFLGKMFCTICPKHCALSNPKCSRSASLIEKATAEYQILYTDK